MEQGNGSDLNLVSRTQPHRDTSAADLEFYSTTPRLAAPLTNMTLNRSRSTPIQQLRNSPVRRLVDIHHSSESETEVIEEITVKVFGKSGGPGKNYVVRNVKVGIISNICDIKQFLQNEFGDKVSGEIEIGYFKGNKHVWMRTDDDYKKVLAKLCDGQAISLWCEGTKKASAKKHAAVDDDGESSSSDEQAVYSKSKRLKRSLSEEKHARVQNFLINLNQSTVIIIQDPNIVYGLKL